MRRGTIGRAAILLALFGSAPAMAADRPAAPADIAVTATRTASEATVRSSRNAPAVRIVTLPEPAGSTAMVRSLPVAEGVDLGVGLFTVVGASEKELLRRRTIPMSDIRPRDRKVPGVGMSLRF